MRNSYFEIEIDEKTGCVKSIINPVDKDGMNWCAGDGCWGKIHKRSWDAGTGELGEIEGRRAELEKTELSDARAVSEYVSDEFSVTVTRYFKENGNFAENYRIKNITDTVICINRDNFGIETPFNDRYVGAGECMVHHCNTHIWCGHNIAWVNALKMGASTINLGLFLTKGAIDCYDQDRCEGPSRGIFVLEPESLLLNSGEEYELEWELFWHEGGDDFFAQLKKFDSYIGIDAVHYTIFEDEKDIEFTVSPVSGEAPEITVCGESVAAEKKDGGWHVKYHAKHRGEYKFLITAGDVCTWARFMVKKNFRSLLEDRVHFIVRNQQCLDQKSPLYGAFMVYDNEYDSVYFDYKNTDHNACRERMNIPLLLMKYLQVKDDAEVRRAIDLYIEFMFREFYEEKTGEVFNNIGKHSEWVRLYNAPGAMLILCEMYFVTKGEKYLDNIMKLAEKYYSVGGKKCYANGLAIGKVIRAFRESGRKKDEERLMELFQTHVDNIISIGTSYPPHEVIYEQTIVTPAVTHVAEMGRLRDDKEYYIREAKRHLECLERFSGMQPDYHLNEIAIRFWDDYWFGKNRTKGDTLPHHLSVLTARAYIAYSLLSGEKKWMDKAEECLRNCMCLIGDNGRGSAAYVYPYKLNGKRGEFFDPWSNDQDLVLYDTLYFADYASIFKI